MISFLVTVKPSETGNGWSVFEGENPVEFINGNFFPDKESAENTATAIRHVRMRNALNQIAKRKII